MVDRKQGTYYCLVEEGNKKFKPGVYAIPFSRVAYLTTRDFVTGSDRVWYQGPKGGVKAIKNKWADGIFFYGYITKNETEMKKFMWAKLKAQIIDF